jgi:alkaline phosphatase
VYKYFCNKATPGIPLTFKIKIMTNKILILIISFVTVLYSSAQDDNKAQETKLSYQSKSFYEVQTFPHKFKSKKPKNVILMIGDGMGTAHIFAAMTANGGELYLNNFKHVGFSKSQSANRFITDSGAAGTAIATGHKANNSAVGMDADYNPVPSVLKIAQKNNLATGVVVTTSLLDATPASFFAHVPNRNMMPEIATALVASDMDVFIGSGREHFIDRYDGLDLIAELTEKGYQVFDTITDLVNVKDGRLVGFLSPSEGRVNERGDQLSITTEVALNILKNNRKGFFLMVEAAQIDNAGHENDMIYLMEEMLDFDRTIGKVLEFAAKDGKTLVIVTSDHETGGLTLTNGDIQSGKITGHFSTGGHTGVMLPVFAYGPGADEFTGIFKNTSFLNKFITLLKLKN